MSHFSSSAQQLPGANPLIGFGSLNVDVTMTGTSLQQTAPPFLLGSNNEQLAFLFWDTGRRITTKRTVRWSFNHPDQWTDWRAIAWYGMPGDGPGQPLIGTTAYWIGNSTLMPTPIDGPASSFVNAPGGTPVAWPWNGDDHVVRTEWGAATLHAKGGMAGGPGSSSLDFSAWIQLVAGGDGNGYFSENDDNIDSIASGSGVSGIANSGSPDFAVGMGGGATLLAGYVTPPPPDLSGLIGKLREVIAGGLLGKYIDKGDPSPPDILRLKLISESIDMVRGEKPTSTDAFEALTAAARAMSPQELKRTIVSTQTTLRRGQAAVKFMESLAAKQLAAAKAAPKAGAKAPAKAPAKEAKPASKAKKS
ncbi:MAG: hypothetical protein JNJ60_10385 [Rhodocyclaceae bacterium]|nr:hypothetical protein [Rhodocyclaceae bacterium]